MIFCETRLDSTLSICLKDRICGMEQEAAYVSDRIVEIKSHLHLMAALHRIFEKHFEKLSEKNRISNRKKEKIIEQTQDKR